MSASDRTRLIPGQKVRAKVVKAVQYGVWFDHSILVELPDLGLERGNLPPDQFREGEEHDVTVIKVSEDGTQVRGTLL